MAVRERVPEILLGPVFSFVSLCAIAIAAIRRRSEYRILLWFGLFIGFYGLRMLAWNCNILGVSTDSPWPDRIVLFADYMMIIPGLLFWVELSVGKFRRLIAIFTALATVVGILSLVWFLFSGQRYTFAILNNVIAICLLIAVAVVIAVPSLARQFLVIQSRVLTMVLPAIALVAVLSNMSWILRRQPPRYAEPLAFAVWTLALGYVAAQRIFANEHRLLAIESELQTARQIQFSILPATVPSASNLRIAAAYHPMSAVAGDFYCFTEVGPNRLGTLVADVSGHGVPAALVSSMMKMAVQSVAACADDPSQVLRSLNHILSPELRGQFISAAYLWIDTEKHCARYSAAGHPPLLWWRNSQGKLEQIESNGLLFGVTPDIDFPACAIPLAPSDRLLLYTDGMTEAENASGEAFGDRHLEHVVRGNRSQTASKLLDRVLCELRDWQPPSTPQLDDITLIVIDVL